MTDKNLDKLQEMIDYLNQLKKDCPTDGMVVNKYFLRHTAKYLQSILDEEMEEKQ